MLLQNFYRPYERPNDFFSISTKVHFNLQHPCPRLQRPGISSNMSETKYESHLNLR